LDSQVDFRSTSRRFAQIVRILRNRWATSADLSLALYGDRHRSPETIRVTIMRHRHELEPYGLRIVSRRGFGGGYWLERI
jgi:hypothetical protein